MTRAKDISKILTDANISGTLDVSGAFTSQGIDDNADATAITITSAENVGIGTASPTALSNYTSVVANNSSGSMFELMVGGTRTANIQTSASAMNIQTRTSIPMVFDTNASERMRIDSSGRVGIGVSSLSLHQMAVHGATGGNATFKVANTSSSGNTTTYLSFMDGSGANSVNSAHFQGFNGANNHYLLGNGTTTFTSDEIAKKNIETTRDGYLEDLAKLRVVKYNWKEDEDGTDKELGLIAQEVEKVFPKLVMLDIDPQIEEKDKKKMIKLSVLPLMLLKALQEANTKITALESRITNLEGA